MLLGYLLRKCDYVFVTLAYNSVVRACGVFGAGVVTFLLWVVIGLEFE